MILMTMNLELTFSQKINYAVYQNNLDAISTAVAVNDGEDRDNVTFRITSVPKFFEDVECKIASINASESTNILELSSFRFILDVDFISQISESVTARVTFEALDSEKNILGSTLEEVTVLPYDYWPGCDIPEMIASFVTPNASSLATIRSMASDILYTWDMKSSLEGYQSEDRNRVLALGAAVYAALEWNNINYVNPPAKFEVKGQRVRLADEVLSNREGTCIDLAVLYASILESIGLNTMIFFVQGHAFAGFWLVDEYNVDIVSWDSASITRMIRNNEICAVECTAFTNTVSIPFDQACSKALSILEIAENFICTVDIKRARSRITPIPVRKMVDGQWVIEREKSSQSTVAPKPLRATYTSFSKRPLTKIDKWKRDLLDITNKNNMISMKQGTKVMPLLIKDVSHFEDLLADGSEFTIFSKPQEWDGTKIYNEKPFESENFIGNYAFSSASELSRKRLRSPMTDTDMEKSLRSIYRLTNKEMEECGCNPLFVAIGILRWYEGKSSGVARYAPLILIPAELKKKQTFFALNKLDEDAVFNVTLFEKLHQEYELDIHNINLPMDDDDGVNVDQVLQVVRQKISGLEGWEVLEGAAIGVFSFSQFAMWNDLSDNINTFEKSKIVKSLIDGVPYPADKDFDKDADPYDLCLTVPADSSQIKAVRAAGNGKTFVMHGPPGTGKSQTITNMITNSLYHGKTVLFVAEKRAALEVVQKRLEEVGIGNHCLELHSKKTVKSKVIDQLRKSLEQCKSYDSEKENRLMANIIALRQKLDVYVKELHMKRAFGLSAYECILRYETFDVEGAVDFSLPSGYTFGNEEDLIDVEEAVLNAKNAYLKVQDLNIEVLNHIGKTTISASIQSDFKDRIDELNAVASDFEKKRKELLSYGLPIDINDQTLRNKLFITLLSMDAKIVKDSDLMSIPNKLSDILKLFSSLIKEMEKFHSIENFNLIKDLKRIKSLTADIGTKLNAAKDKGYISVNSMLFESVNICKKYSDIILRHNRDLEIISKQWNKGVYEFNEIYPVGPNWIDVGSKGFFGKRKARKEFMSRIYAQLRDPSTKFEDLSVTVNIISEIAPDIFSASSIPMSFSESVGQINVELEKIQKVVNSAEKAIELMGDLQVSPDDFASLYDKSFSSKDVKIQADGAYEVWLNVRSKFKTFARTDLELSDPSDSIRFCNELLPHIGDMFDWVNWNYYAEKLSNRGLSEVINSIKSGIDEGLLIKSVYRSIYKHYITICRQDSEPLRSFSANTFEGWISQFKKLDSTYTTLNRNILKYNLSQNVPNNLDYSSNGTETYILYRAINSSRIRKSIRTLLSEIPNILPRICPCLLMSPQSVSQYITMDYPKFDLVIFDESSQITTCKAIGALGRANAAVIAGDSKQLPPTSFFMKKIEPSEDDDDMVDVESFLDDCLSLNMPETYLEWHYRSKHESLIAFSNRMFYGNKMLTFPSPNDLDTKVEMKAIQGTYERRRRTNPIEARAIVDEIYRRVMDKNLRKQSIGVVAFGISQQNCIQDMLDDRIGNDTAFFTHLNEMEEEMFVKNLETVQGDERDIILFSIGYGPDSKGNIYQNFGPINREGGGRRLNVAVSRARMEMIIFSSMKYTDIKLTSVSSKGVKSLREFLKFAENEGRFIDQNVNSVRARGTSILEDISKTLLNNGYETHFDVGTSQFKVDIAIIDPDNPSKYILGLLSDGDSYKSSENTRDREYARADVLQRLGWNLMNVWSIEWYFNKGSIINQILKNLRSIRDNPTLKEVEDCKIDPDYGLNNDIHGEKSKEVDTHPMAEFSSKRIDYDPIKFSTEYVDAGMAVHDFLTVKKYASHIIKEESPINEAYLFKLYCRYVNIRLNKSKREFLINKLRVIFNPDIIGEYITYWAEDKDRGLETYRVSDDPAVNRTIDNISIAEVVNACVDTVKINGSVSVESAVYSVARTLGYKRKGANIDKVISDALDLAIKNGKIKEMNGRLTIR